MEEPRDCNRDPVLGVRAREPCWGRGSWQWDMWSTYAVLDALPLGLSRVTPDDEARFCEAALIAYLEQLVTRHIFPCVDSFFSALSLLSSCELIRAPSEFLLP